MIGKLFVYKNIRLSDDRKTVNLEYELQTDDQTFNLTEKYEFPAGLPTSSTVDRLLKALHLAAGISYYKAALPPAIDHDYFMDTDEADFWNTVFSKGLAEFLHNNDLDENVLVNFSSHNGSIKPSEQDDIGWNETGLLGIGGGKDSIVAGELLKSIGLPFRGFVMATGDNEGQSRAVADKMNVDLFAVNRTIDPQIHEINKMDGAYNGHVPVSLLFALAGSLSATTDGSKYVIVGNESSASIPQIGNVNHQWSKSLEFEQLFKAYLHAHISPDLQYFSAIRPLSSVAVAKIFAKLPLYFEVFSSDNTHFKTNANSDAPRWDNTSTKSLSSFILLSPWVNDDSLIRIFGDNLLDSSQLDGMLLDLLGAGEPVLDCVGTPNELRLSLTLLGNQNRETSYSLLRSAKEKGLLVGNYDEMLASYLDIDKPHAFPENFAEKLTKEIKERLL